MISVASDDLFSLLHHISQPDEGAGGTFPPVRVAGVATPAVAIGVVTVSQPEKQARKVGVPG
jgi:hypothetical protein